MMILDFIKGFSLCTNTLKNHNRANQHHKQELVFLPFPECKDSDIQNGYLHYNFQLNSLVERGF